MVATIKLLSGDSYLITNITNIQKYGDILIITHLTDKGDYQTLKYLTTDVKSKPDEYRDTVWGLDNDSPFIRFRGTSINYMTLGLVGCGCAGQLVAKKAEAFGMKVIAYDPYIDPAKVPESVELVGLDEFLSRADIVSLHCIVSPQTKNMFNKETFAKMKKGSYFINTARGELVVEDDLIEALNSNHLAGAAIDVTVKEPIASDSR